MLIINKSSVNEIIVTLSEKCTLSSPYFLFEFVNDITRTSKLFICADTSSFTDRYNKFLITETSGTENLLSGIISLSETGFYHYRIFEQTSSTNLSISNVSGLVESGKLKVIGTTVSHPTYDNQPKQYVTYG